MPRTFLMLALSAMVSSFAFAQDKVEVKVDPVAAELETAKVSYRASVEAASKKLIKAFENEDKRIATDPKLKAEDKLKRLDQLATEKEAFEIGGTLPKSATLPSAVTTYLDDLKPAQALCEKAFDEAANKYLTTNRAAAKAVLAEKAEFFKITRVPRTRPFLRFASRDDHVELDQTINVLDLQKPFTIEVWARWDVKKVAYLAGDEVWVGMSDQIPVTTDGGWAIRTLIAKDGNKVPIEFVVTSSSAKGPREWLSLLTPAQPVKAEDWQHVAVTRTATELRLYWNGKLAAKKPLAGITLHASPTNTFVGVRQHGYPGRDFSGDVAGFRLSSKSLYSDAFTPKLEFAKEDSTLVVLDFAAADDKKIPDTSGKKHHGSVVGAKSIDLKK